MRHLALNLLLFFCISSTYTACISSKNSTKKDTSSSNYKHLSRNESIKNKVNQSICLEGSISIEISQHMLKPSFKLGEEAAYFLIDYNEGNQIIVYYKNIKIPQDQKKHKFFGIVKKISGKGKGGTTHTEYYLNLDKIEL